MLTKIGNLPDNLTVFDCSRTQVTKIENLSDNLTAFYCDYTQITKIENLPDNLTTFDCRDIPITKIENLPSGLLEFYCSPEKITHVDNILIEWWRHRGGFELRKYNIIKRLQRRMRIRFDIKNKKAKIIQNGCHAWLWSTRCKDETLGIVLRLNLRELEKSCPNFVQDSNLI
ncbi:MAG: hypothetical protein EHM20_08590 [Alphaproteobacteria bacterium]|nr:MAG: hypothetical protein EHM20_08590 [Alphaproteobacteria bacterium]